MSQFKTEQLKQLLSYANQGVGVDKLVELTSYLGITVKDNELTLKSTNGTDYLSVISAVDNADDMDITVDAELFVKLVGKITSETINLTISNNALVVSGNGTYFLELKLDEQGNLLRFPNKFPDSTQPLGELSEKDLKTISSAIKASLSTNNDSVYSYYYFGDIIASTDRAMLSVLNKQVFDEPRLFNRNFVDLMCMGPASVKLSCCDDTVVSESTNGGVTILICTKSPKPAIEYNVSGLNKMLSLEVNSFCRVRKAELLNLLDRMALFVSKFDSGAINIKFTDTCMEISSMNDSGVEAVAYTECKDAVDFDIKIDIGRLITQLKSYSSDVVDLYYGSSMCIKLVDGDTTQIIALMR